MGFYDAIRIGASGAAEDFTVDRSLRFNNGDTPKLTRTPSSAGNQKTWTFSVWLKRGNLGTSLKYIYRVDGSHTDRLEFDSSDRLFLQQRDTSIRITTRKFRDVSAWYHIVIAMDTTQATADNRTKIYVNGEEVTEFDTKANNSQNTDGMFNSTNEHKLGLSFDGYMAEINYIDGQQLTPASFGETNADTGQWNPIDTSGLTFGTNGFRLKFADNSGTTATTLGKDSSGNGNNFTPNNFSVADGIDGDSFADTPTNNFCTLNALVTSQSAQSLANGNLQRSGNAYKCVGTFLLKNNKYYFEVKVEDGNGNGGIGVTQADTDYRSRDNTEAAAYFTNGEYKIEGGSQLSGWSTYGNGDIIGVAIDTSLSTPKVWFSKNNTWQGTGDPTTAGYSLTAGKEYVFNVDHTSGSSSTTATAFFGAHKGEFNYTPPTGFVAASSTNLPDPTILLPNKHFDTLLYTGNGGTQSITGLNFAPDWAWIKERTGAYHHSITDSVRGVLKTLSSSRVDIAEKDESSGLNQLLSNGLGFNGEGFYYVNRNSQSYVGWNWNAGDTDGKTYTVTVVDDSGNKYRFDGFGTSAVTLDLAEGGTYIFNYPSAHPLKFSTTADGTHGGGSEYTTGVTHNSSTQVTIVVAASAPTLYYYCSIHSGMGGQINTNSTLGSSNFAGSIQTITKVNATAGFSIVKWTIQDNNVYTVGHGLGVAPKAILMKSRTEGLNWDVFHTEVGNTKRIKLNSTAAPEDYTGPWNDTTPTSTVFTSTGSWLSGANKNIIAYVFSEVAGYSKFGSYTGNNANDGTFVFTGFSVAWLMVKRTDSTRDWLIYDSTRSTFNVIDDFLEPNQSTAEQTASANSVDFVSNGFKFRNTSGDMNGSGTYIYFAFAEAPFRNARAR